MNDQKKYFANDKATHGDHRNYFSLTEGILILMRAFKYYED